MKAAILALILALLTFFASPAAAVIEETDVDSAAQYTYTIDPAARTVKARIELTVIADKPDRTTEEGVFQYYFNGYRLLIPHEAENLQVADLNGVELRFERTSRDDISDLVVLNFNGNIYYRQQARLVVEFVLSTGIPGSDSIVRINPAYVSFAAWTSPLLEEASVTVQLPPGYEDRSRGDTSFTAENDETGPRLTAADIDPETYFSLVSLVNDDALEIDVLNLPPEVTITDEAASPTVKVLSWPGDDGWRTSVLDGVDDALPALADLVGRPWPIDGELTIIESFTPYLDGYAGWYNSETDVIEVGDERDEHTLLHELSHVWFHSDLFAHRWITEGLADLFAAETIAVLGRERPRPRPTATTDKEAISLDGFDSVSQPDEERWAYAASWGLMESVAAEIGMDGLAVVVDTAAKRELSYVGDAEPETVRTAADWHRFLDLVENLQGVDQGPVTELIDEWVLDDESAQFVGAGLFDRRKTSRAQYFDLTEAGGEWAAPFDVRNAMMFWRFAKADGLMDQAEAALNQRDELRTTLEPTGAILPPSLEQLYESSAKELGPALDRANAGGAEVREAHDHAWAEPSIVEQVGLIGTDLRSEAAEAEAAFSNDRMDEAIEQANEVDDLAVGANRAGWFRIGLVLALIAVLASGAWFVLVRRRPSAGGPTATPEPPIAAPEAHATL